MVGKLNYFVVFILEVYIATIVLKLQVMKVEENYVTINLNHYK